jgi:hypothetical protein
MRQPSAPSPAVTPGPRSLVARSPMSRSTRGSRRSCWDISSRRFFIADDQAIAEPACRNGTCSKRPVFNSMVGAKFACRWRTRQTLFCSIGDHLGCWSHDINVGKVSATRQLSMVTEAGAQHKEAVVTQAGDQRLVHVEHIAWHPDVLSAVRLVAKPDIDRSSSFPDRLPYSPA